MRSIPLCSANTSRSHIKRLVTQVMFLGVLLCIAACTPAPWDPPIPLAMTPTPAPSPEPQLALNTWKTHWLQGIPCTPPCWEGITPGTTTISEALVLLKRNALIVKAEIITYPNIPDAERLHWDFQNEGGGGSALYDVRAPAPVIQSIEVVYPASYRFGDIIAVYGEPSHIAATFGSGFEPPNKQVEFTLSVVYLSHGFSLVTESSQQKPTLSPDLVFTGFVTFFVPTAQGFDAASKSSRFSQLQSWQGFQSFDFYCRDSHTGTQPCPPLTRINNQR